VTFGIFVLLATVVVCLPMALGAIFTFAFKQMPLRKVAVLSASVLPCGILASGLWAGLQIVAVVFGATGIITILSCLGAAVAFGVGIFPARTAAEWTRSHMRGDE